MKKIPERENVLLTQQKQLIGVMGSQENPAIRSTNKTVQFAIDNVKERLSAHLVC